MATPTAAGLLRTLTLPLPTDPSTAPTTAHPSGPFSAEPPTMADVRGPVVNTPSGASVAPAGDTAKPVTAATSPVERTGPSVVLRRTHLISLVALLVVLMTGVGVLGLAMFKRGGGASPTAAIPSVPAGSEAGSSAQGQPDQQQQAAVPVPEPAGPPAPDAPTPPPPPPAAATSGTSAAVPGAVKPPDPAAKKAKPAPKPSEELLPAEPKSAPAEEPPPPVTPEIAPVTFDDVKVLVAQGKNMRDRDAVLRLAGDHLSVVDRSGKAEIVSVPYASISQVFFSRSKQPKWKGPDGQQAVASVDLGKMSFFRGDRNWLIILTQADPVFIRFEDSDLRAALATVQERTGLTIQR
jgi:hypothetical protein